MSSHVLKFTPENNKYVATGNRELFQQRWNECATTKSKSYLKHPRNTGYSKEATYQVLGTLQTCALLGGTQRVEESNLLHEHTNTKKHPVVLKYYPKEHLHSMVM